MRIICLLTFLFYLFVNVSLAASHTPTDVPDSPFDVDLWVESGSAATKTNMNDNVERNFKPSIRIYLPKALKPTKAVIIFPGGGYRFLAMRHEGYDWGAYFEKMGIAAIVLKYRKPLGSPDMPVSDAQEAIRLVKENSHKWNIDPENIGIMGFSAGGHLASTIATHAPQDVKLAFQILFYPVITMNPTNAHKGSRERFLGKNPSEQSEQMYSNELQVQKDTPRAFIVLSGDDDVVKPINATSYHSALLDKGVLSEIHIYPTGGHGWGIKKKFKYHNEMMSAIESWLLNN
jgi:Esterase/lipase